MSTPSSDPAPGDTRRVVFVADVVGHAGRSAVDRLLPGLLREVSADFCILNGENAAGGAGMTRPIVEGFFRAGVGCVTSGNHVWANRDIFTFIGKEPRVLRPANFSAAAPGTGYGVFTDARGSRVLVLNLQGRVFMDPSDCPFRIADEILERHADVRLRFLDFHAEATSEKVAMGWHLDGRVTAVLGTHTHIPTADARVLPRGTAYITDAGMTGPYDSVIGVKKEMALQRMRTGVPVRFEPAAGDVRLSAVLVTVEAGTGCALDIQLIVRRLEE